MAVVKNKALKKRVFVNKIAGMGKLKKGFEAGYDLYGLTKAGAETAYEGAGLAYAGVQEGAESGYETTLKSELTELFPDIFGKGYGG